MKTCLACQGDKHIMQATGDKQHPLRVVHCPDCERQDCVWVYRNLKHGKKSRPLYSIMRNGRVIARLHRVLLRDCRFVVRPAGRLKAVQTKRKNVHAFVVGRLVGKEGAFGTDANSAKPLGLKIVYDPYKMNAFQTESGNCVVTAGGCLLNERGMTACYVVTRA